MASTPVLHSIRQVSCGSGQPLLKLNCFIVPGQYSDLVRLQQPELPSAFSSCLTSVAMLCLCSASSAKVEGVSVLP